MSKDILGYYGQDTPKTTAPGAKSGGEMATKDVMNYKPPVGPSNINDAKSPGLHGTNHGCAPGQGKH